MHRLGQHLAGIIGRPADGNAGAAVGYLTNRFFLRRSFLD